jgi:hypothetical protein
MGRVRLKELRCGVRTPIQTPIEPRVPEWLARFVAFLLPDLRVSVFQALGERAIARDDDRGRVSGRAASSPRRWVVEEWWRWWWW